MPRFHHLQGETLLGCNCFDFMIINENILREFQSASRNFLQGVDANMEETEKIIQLCFILFSQCVAYSGTIALERGDFQENLEEVQSHGEIQESEYAEAEEAHACVKSCIDQRQAKITLRELQHVGKIVAYQWMVHDHWMKTHMNFQETENLVCVQQAISEEKPLPNLRKAGPRGCFFTFFALTSCTALKSFWFVVFVDSSIDRLGRLLTIVSHHGLDLCRLPGSPSLPCTFCILFSCEGLLLAQPVA
jgi:hypothetical protein